MTPATPPETNDPRVLFEYFSSEYAQALQALSTIEKQASTLMFMGHNDELRAFLAQFLEMAHRIQRFALEKKEPNFAEWFSELIEKAEGLRQTVEK